MSDWRLDTVLSELQKGIQEELGRARASFGHPVTKGDASQNVWLDLLKEYLPKRYETTSAHVVDSTGQFSEQLDIVIFDRQYSPFILNWKGQKIVPAESVYAAFEAKQSINAGVVDYAMGKMASLRKLHRTSLPIPTASGTAPAKVPSRFIGGLLTFESDWKPPLADPLSRALATGDDNRRLDLGCVAAHGIFMCSSAAPPKITVDGMPATAFLFELIARLQEIATVGMIDVRAYARWLR